VGLAYGWVSGSMPSVVGAEGASYNCIPGVGGEEDEGLVGDGSTKGMLVLAIIGVVPSVAGVYSSIPGVGGEEDEDLDFGVDGGGKPRGVRGLGFESSLSSASSTSWAIRLIPRAYSYPCI
jgi:hypothetical protein